MSGINIKQSKKDIHSKEHIKISNLKEKYPRKIKSGSIAPKYYGKNIKIFQKDENNFANAVKVGSKKNNILLNKKYKVAKYKNTKNNLKRIHNTSNNKKRYNFIITMIFLVILNVSYQLKQSMIFSFSSEITLKIEGLGMLNIFYGGNSCNAGIFPRPDEIYINDNRQNDINDKYDFENPFNVIKLVWSNTNNNCNCLFKNCSNIIEIDFSKFDFTSGLNGYQMFYNCISLTSVNLYSSGTIIIHNLVEMFSYCKSLSSIDLYKFNISGIRDTSGMFRSCHSLTSLDLINFSNSNLNKGDYMFYDCPNLIYVNYMYGHYCHANNPSLSHFISAPKNIVFCSYCSARITSLVTTQCAINDCTSNWSQNQKKLDLESNTCVTDCSITNNKYLYLSKCYKTCPDGTYPISYNCNNCHPDCKKCDGPAETDNTNCKSCKSQYKYLKYGNCVYNCINGFYNDENDNSIKICKCDLIKCFKCSKESLNQNLCLTCNEGYYPKENDNNNIDSFIDCYNNPQGYYLDNNDGNPIYKLCYETCSKCDIGGSITYHNCAECKPDFYFELILNNGFKNCYKKCPYYFYHDKNVDKYYCTEFEECPEQYSKLIFNKNECINKCEEDEEYKYEFRKRCYKECPEDSYANNNTFYCNLICPEERPFELVSLQICVKYCSIKDLLIEECILNYQSEDENKLHDIMIDNINHDFISEDYNISHLV